MLLLSFHLGERSYATPCRQILEIVPLTGLEAVPGGPPYLAGQFDYRGRVVPAIDLRQLLTGEPCRGCLSTRIVIVEQTAPQAELRAIGLLAERVTETFSKAAHEFRGVGVDVAEMPFLGGVFMSERGMIHLLDLERLCESLRSRSLTSPALRELLFDRAWTG
jgi:chemotaxis-related protein WspB